MINRSFIQFVFNLQNEPYQWPEECFEQIKQVIQNWLILFTYLMNSLLTLLVLAEKTEFKYKTSSLYIKQDKAKSRIIFEVLIDIFVRVTILKRSFQISERNFQHEFTK